MHVILDIVSSQVVGWLIEPRESVDLAGQLIADSVTQQDVMLDELAQNADRGISMPSKPVAISLDDVRMK